MTPDISDRGRAFEYKRLESRTHQFPRGGQTTGAGTDYGDVVNVIFHGIMFFTEALMILA